MSWEKVLGNSATGLGYRALLCHCKVILIPHSITRRGSCIIVILKAKLLHVLKVIELCPKKKKKSVLLNVKRKPSGVIAKVCPSGNVVSFS